MDLAGDIIQSLASYLGIEVRAERRGGEGRGGGPAGTQPVYIHTPTVMESIQSMVLPTTARVNVYQMCELHCMASSKSPIKGVTRRMEGGARVSERYIKGMCRSPVAS